MDIRKQVLHENLLRHDVSKSNARCRPVKLYPADLRVTIAQAQLPSVDELPFCQEAEKCKHIQPHILKLIVKRGFRSKSE